MQNEIFLEPDCKLQALFVDLAKRGITFVNFSFDTYAGPEILIIPNTRL